jgi:hypothetical protein
MWIRGCSFLLDNVIVSLSDPVFVVSKVLLKPTGQLFGGVILTRHEFGFPLFFG